MHAVLTELGLQEKNSGACGADWITDPSGPEVVSYNPATGEAGTVIQAGTKDYEVIVKDALAAFEKWRQIPLRNVEKLFVSWARLYALRKKLWEPSFL